MNQQWNNEVNSTMSVITPPSLFYPKSGPTIFLAGTIHLTDWRTTLIHYIEDKWTEDDVTIYNPKRNEEFIPEEMENEQSVWTISTLNMCDYILMHLVGEHGSPISTLELGLFMNHPNLYLSMSSAYSREEVIRIHCGYYSMTNIYETPLDSINAIKKHYQRKVQ